MLGWRQGTPGWADDTLWGYTEQAATMREERQEWVYTSGRHWAAKGKERVGLRSIVRNNKRNLLGPERSLSKVGTSRPHDLDTPHGMVAIKITTTTTKTEISSLQIDLDSICVISP